ncbi:MAG: pyridoxamine 5'-phosphate oxidase family protein [Desulfobacteraceae bacterium]|jgi:nitroimidazol reductase NimA-like FMN-containing flavoprotein (pyridoxamine 5'-phosphate oxidase superfamily)|nr:pyridoxamine 5'-phosphate oxidase family protein [Desulfobacteraceae bacterium]
MLETMKSIAKENSLCVLATVNEDAEPHCSLMAYAIDDACRELYMATGKSTQKYKNLQKNPTVSLLIDTREMQFREQTRALTISGVYQPIENEKTKTQIRSKLLKQHPHLKDFFSHADIVFICIKLRSFLLLNNVSESHYVEINDA